MSWSVTSSPVAALTSRAPPCDNAVGGSPVRVHLASAHRLLLRQQAELDEAAWVEEEVDPLADRELAARLLFRDLLGAAHPEVLLAARLELGDLGREFIAHDPQFYGAALAGPTSRSSRERHLSRKR